MWALQLGLQGLVVGWKLGMETSDVLVAAEGKYLGGADAEEKKAVERFATGFRVWWKEVVKWSEAKKKLAVYDQVEKDV
jgi:hypothetical protein